MQADEIIPTRVWWQLSSDVILRYRHGVLSGSEEIYLDEAAVAQKNLLLLRLILPAPGSILVRMAEKLYGCDNTFTASDGENLDKRLPLVLGSERDDLHW